MNEVIVEVKVGLAPLTVACSAGAGVVFAALRRHGSNGTLTVAQFGAALRKCACHVWGPVLAGTSGGIVTLR